MLGFKFKEGRKVWNYPRKKRGRWKVFKRTYDSRLADRFNFAAFATPSKSKTRRKHHWNKMESFEKSPLDGRKANAFRKTFGKLSDT